MQAANYVLGGGDLLMSPKDKTTEQPMEELAQVRREIGDIANRLNNALLGVLGNIDLARMYVEDERSMRVVLEKLAYADRIFPEMVDLTQRLLDLSAG